jgi:hypothetical protein
MFESLIVAQQQQQQQQHLASGMAVMKLYTDEDGGGGSDDGTESAAASTSSTLSASRGFDVTATAAVVKPLICRGAFVNLEKVSKCVVLFRMIAIVISRCLFSR